MHTYVAYCCIFAITTKWDHVSLCQIFNLSTLSYICYTHLVTRPHSYICLHLFSDSCTLVYISLHLSSDSSTFVYDSSTLICTCLVTCLHSSTFVYTRLVTRLHCLHSSTFVYTRLVTRLHCLHSSTFVYTRLSSSSASSVFLESINQKCVKILLSIL